MSVVDGVSLKPLPYSSPDELVAVWHEAPDAPGPRPSPRAPV